MKSKLECKLCGASLGSMHHNEQQFELVRHYEYAHQDDIAHLKSLRRDYLEWKEQYGLSSIVDLLLTPTS